MLEAESVQQQQPQPDLVPCQLSPAQTIPSVCATDFAADGVVCKDTTVQHAHMSATLDKECAQQQQQQQQPKDTPASPNGDPAEAENTQAPEASICAPASCETADVPSVLDAAIAAYKQEKRQLWKVRPS